MPCQNLFQETKEIKESQQSGNLRAINCCITEVWKKFKRNSGIDT